jgi:hypothetical protein
LSNTFTSIHNLSCGSIEGIYAAPADILTVDGHSEAFCLLFTMTVASLRKLCWIHIGKQQSNIMWMPLRKQNQNINRNNSYADAEIEHSIMGSPER